MGNIPEITFDKYPEQGANVGRRVVVCYQYDTDNSHEGVCIRDDCSHPFTTIFQLDNKRVVLSTECQYHWLGSYQPR